MITWYRMKIADQKGLPEKVYKRYIFECKPSPRAMFYL
jgi:hypothetical protein